MFSQDTHFAKQARASKSLRLSQRVLHGGGGGGGWFVGNVDGATVGRAVGDAVGAWEHRPHDRRHFTPPLEPQNSSSLAIKIEHDVKSSLHATKLVGDADGAIVLIPLTPPMASSALRRAMVGRDRISGRDASMDSSISQGSPGPRR